MIDNIERNVLSNMQQNKAASKQQNHHDVSFGAFLTNTLAPTQENDVGFKEIWQERFPNAYYHVMDASKIPQEHWQRNDYPFEKFFASQIDDSILNWQPSGIEPQMGNASVQARMESILGQNAIVVPKELEEKLKNNPQLARKISQNIDHLFAQQGFVSTSNTSALIVFDENGDIARFRLTSGGSFSVSSDEFVQAAKKRRAEQEQARKNAEEYANEQALMEYLARQQGMDSLLN